MIHHSSYHNIHPTIHVNSIQQRGADFLFENANNQTLKKVTHLNQFIFEMLYEKFNVYWKRIFAKGTHFGWIHHRVLNGRFVLGLILFHMAYGATNTKLFLFVGVFLSTISRYLHWARKVLAYVLDEILYFTLSCLSYEYLVAIGNKIAEIQNEVMRGCIAIIDFQWMGSEGSQILLAYHK
jgi:hypothetical protein